MSLTKLFEHKAQYAISNTTKNKAIKLIMEALKCGRGDVQQICKAFNLSAHQLAYEIYREHPEESEYHFFTTMETWSEWHDAFVEEADVAGVSYEDVQFILKNGYVISHIKIKDDEENVK